MVSLDTGSITQVGPKLWKIINMIPELWKINIIPDKHDTKAVTDKHDTSTNFRENDTKAQNAHRKTMRSTKMTFAGLKELNHRCPIAREKLWKKSPSESTTIPHHGHEAALKMTKRNKIQPEKRCGWQKWPSPCAQQLIEVVQKKWKILKKNAKWIDDHSSPQPWNILRNDCHRQNAARKTMRLTKMTFFNTLTNVN